MTSNESLATTAGLGVLFAMGAISCSLLTKTAETVGVPGAAKPEVAQAAQQADRAVFDWVAALLGLTVGGGSVHVAHTTRKPRAVSTPSHA